MKLCIVIPALNEEGAIESIIQRSLRARPHIISGSSVSQVEIVVVSDGSTDRTVELAQKYTEQISLVVFPKNRGYGAAIMAGWQRSDAELLGFLDADGTCDPLFFAELCAALEREEADVVLGCRLNPASRMPAVRRAGNLMFAWLLSALSSSRVRDTASGMRVVRRLCLRQLLPLPVGLDFTPAMSARAMLSGSLKIVEVDMPYHERIGRSKLSVVKEGLRFLKVIVETAFLYRAPGLLLCLTWLFGLGAFALMIYPAQYYLAHRSLLEWMIYRFVVSDLLATCACLFWCASFLTGRMVRMALSQEVQGRRASLAERIFLSPWFWALPAGLILVGGVLVLHSFLSLIRTGHTTEHWSHFIVMTFCYSAAAILLVTRGVHYVLSLLDNRQKYWQASAVASYSHWDSPKSA